MSHVTIIFPYFPAFSHIIPIKFPSCSHNFPIIFSSFPHHFPIIFPSCSHNFLYFIAYHSHHFPINFLSYSHSCPIIFSYMFNVFLLIIPSHSYGRAPTMELSPWCSAEPLAIGGILGRWGGEMLRMALNTFFLWEKWGNLWEKWGNMYKKTWDKSFFSTGKMEQCIKNMYKCTIIRWWKHHLT